MLGWRDGMNRSVWFVSMRTKFEWWILEQHRSLIMRVYNPSATVGKGEAETGESEDYRPTTLEDTAGKQ